MNRSQAHHLLGLPPGASETDIKKAYRRLVKKRHPDINPDPGAQEQFVQLKQAFDCLLSEQDTEWLEVDEEAERYTRWRNEQRLHWRQQQEEKTRQRLQLLRKVYKVMNPVIAVYLLFVSLLVLDFTLPPIAYPEEVVEVHRVYESAGGRDRESIYQYEDIFFRDFSLRVSKKTGVVPPYGKATVYASPMLQTVRKAVIAEEGVALVLKPAYGIYATFGFLMPLALILGIVYYQLPMQGEGRLNVGLVLVFMAFFQLLLLNPFSFSLSF